MGGKPWSSSACAVCKKRKVKVSDSSKKIENPLTEDRQCGLEEPQCARCVKRGIPCPGYPDRSFIHHKFTRSSYEKPDVETIFSTPLTRTRRSLLPRTVPSAPQTRMQMSSVYILNYFPIDIKESFGVESWYAILENLLILPSKSLMLEKAISALSCIYLGKIKGDESILRYGVELYNEGIRLLANKLRRGILDDDVLYTTVVFQVLEIIHCPHGLRIWLSHKAATNAILKRSYSNITASANPIKKAIVDIEKLATMYAVTAPKGSMNNWQSLLLSPAASPLDELFEIYVSINELFIKVEEIRSIGSQTSHADLSACCSLKRRILTWYIEKGSTIGHPPTQYLHGESPCADLSSNGLFGLPYRFQNMSTARYHILYWMALMTVEMLIHVIFTSMTHASNQEFSKSTSISHESCIMAEYYADQICRSIPYCLQEKMSSWGTHVILSCMIHVKKPYISLRRKAKFQWCRDALQVMKKRGIDIAGILSDLNLDIQRAFEASTVGQVTEMILRDDLFISPFKSLALESSSPGSISDQDEVEA
ncbi:uncharacterized protein N7483_002302 [Penicillium malachiteum]|uniref:uncharacterized protein n=1 Tax=Penicillium malachiteum TaxID=1324776 RepID=UPI0025466D75|nr:uncharacterized protein N7483_002302 [Penicillium malachiteum]KAJ5737177.1 hypothetical protein N7483_002302 [Penicillium malachiteum]